MIRLFHARIFQNEINISKNIAIGGLHTITNVL
jgi:hypothetical protein